MKKLLIFTAGVVTGAMWVTHTILNEKVIVSYDMDGTVTFKLKEDQPA